MFVRRVGWWVLGIFSRLFMILGPRDRLRVLAYHGIEDEARFREQMGYLVEHFQIVSTQDVLAFLDGEILPSRAVWLTFDDGDPTVVDVGIPILDEIGADAALFVCPGLVDSVAPFWWQLVAAAHEVGLLERDLSQIMHDLKTSPDDIRRSEIRRLAELLERVGWRLEVAQLTRHQLLEWKESGRAIGNHTWDHPLLDQTPPDEQIRQIQKAHEWFRCTIGESPTLFAYPNGNWTVLAENALTRLGYRVGALFDHRLAVGDTHLRLSRIRVNSDDSIRSFAARVSGVHPMISHIRSRAKEIKQLSLQVNRSRA